MGRSHVPSSFNQRLCVSGTSRHGGRRQAWLRWWSTRYQDVQRRVPCLLIEMLIDLSFLISFAYRIEPDLGKKPLQFLTPANNWDQSCLLTVKPGCFGDFAPGQRAANTRRLALVITTSLFVTLNTALMARQRWGRNKTSWLGNEASHSSSGELMITCRSTGLLHLHANRLLRAASPWQAPIFSALSCPRATKESLEVFYLRQRRLFLVCQQEKTNQLRPRYTIHMDPADHVQHCKCFSVLLLT